MISIDAIDSIKNAKYQYDRSLVTRVNMKGAETKLTNLLYTYFDELFESAQDAMDLMKRYSEAKAKIASLEAELAEAKKPTTNKKNG